MKMNIRKRILMVHSKNAIVLYLRANQHHWNQVNPGSAKKVIKVLALHCKAGKTMPEPKNMPQESEEDPLSLRIFQRHSSKQCIRGIVSSYLASRTLANPSEKSLVAQSNSGLIRKRPSLSIKPTFVRSESGARASPSLNGCA